MTLFLDSYSWIEYFRGGEKGERIWNILKKEKVYTSNLIIAEVISKFKREGLKKVVFLMFFTTSFAVPPLRLLNQVKKYFLPSLKIFNDISF